MVFKCFSYVFASVSDACFKTFICLQTYVANVTSECFKYRSGVASPSSLSTASPQCLLLPTPAGHPSPLPLFSMLVPFEATWAPCGRVKRCENYCKHRHPDMGPLSSQKSTKKYIKIGSFLGCVDIVSGGARAES
jgi:hypothetical protein